MKKSIETAMEQAKRYSEKCPTIRVRVMDKPRKHAVMCASDWVYHERILEGWVCLAEFKNGQRLR